MSIYRPRYFPLPLPLIGKTLFALCMLAVVCGVSRAQEAPEAAEPAEAEVEVEAVDPFEVPDAATADLVGFIEGLLGMRPEGRDRESVFAFHRKRSVALIEAADNVLAGEPTDAQRATAVQAKMIALSLRVQMGEEQVAQEMAAVVAKLKEQGLAKLARDAETILLRTQLVTLAGTSREQATEVIGKVTEFVTTGPIGMEQAQLAMEVAQLVERFPDAELAARVTAELGTALGGSGNEMIVSAGRMLEATARRMGLVGSEIEVYGTTLDDEALDWKSYRGKVVLVDFWATWCGPCREEIPNMLALYDAYHDRGFDIVGISVDENPQALLSFVQENALPWTIVADQNQDPAAERPSLAEYYGISAIPTMILVGKDGKVISLGARGPVLHQHLVDLLGPIEEETEEPAAAEE